MSEVSVALVGARRVRQGLGPFVARILTEQGARVPAFLGTTEVSVAQATEDLARVAGVSAKGHTNLDELLDQEPVDALAILSPSPTHASFLEAALERGLHVLCEKPLTWGGDDPAGAALALAEGFHERGLLLTENCQWPYALPAFEELHGEVGPLRSFGMRLSPASRGEQMLGDALPHPLSIVQALCPDMSIQMEDIHLSSRNPDAEELVLEAWLTAGDARIPFRIELMQGETLPREATLTINGKGARRRVRTSDYALFLSDGAREVGLPDPLRSLLSRFLADLEQTLGGGPPPSVTPIIRRAALLQTAVRAFREE